MQTSEFTSNACSQEKFITRPLPAKVGQESPIFLERIHGDISGTIHPPCGLFKNFIVFIDASCRWSNDCLLTTRNKKYGFLKVHYLNSKPKNVVLRVCH